MYSAEWQTRQWPLATSAPGPSFSVAVSFGNSIRRVSASAPPAIASPVTNIRTLNVCRMTVSLRGHYVRRLDDVAHVTRRVPGRFQGLGLSDIVDRAYLDRVGPSTERQSCLPLAKGILAKVLAESGRSPGLPAING